jgi:hypothetical protein
MHLAKASIRSAHSRSTPIDVGIQQLHRRLGNGRSLTTALGTEGSLITNDGDNSLLATALS